MSLILDAGAFLAVERWNRDLLALLKGELEEGRAPVTHGGVVGQVWRGGSGRQANLARFLPAVEVVAVDEDLGRRAGLLLANAGQADVIDAALVGIAVDDDVILTSDPEDLVALAVAAGLQIELLPI